MKKLIRDGVPALAQQAGTSLRTRCSAMHERPALAAKKVLEEAAEFERGPSLEELADVIEAVHLSLRAHGWSEGELESARKRKVSSHGAFDEWLVLEMPASDTRESSGVRTE